MRPNCTPSGALTIEPSAYRAWPWVPSGNSPAMQQRLCSGTHLSHSPAMNQLGIASAHTCPNGRRCTGSSLPQRACERRGMCAGLYLNTAGKCRMLICADTAGLDRRGRRRGGRTQRFASRVVDPRQRTALLHNVSPNGCSPNGFMMRHLSHSTHSRPSRAHLLGTSLSSRQAAGRGSYGRKAFITATSPTPLWKGRILLARRCCAWNARRFSWPRSKQAERRAAL